MLNLLPPRLRQIVGVLVRHAVLAVDEIEAVVTGKPPTLAQQQQVSPRPPRHLTAEAQRELACVGYEALRRLRPAMPPWETTAVERQELLVRQVRRLFLRMPPLDVEGLDGEALDVFAEAVLLGAEVIATRASEEPST